MSELITLDGHPLTGVTRDGIWRVTELSGWWDRPAPKRAGESRANGDGSYVTPVHYGSRLISIRGRVISKNHEYLHLAMGQLNSLCLRGGAQLLVSGHGPAQWATVQPRDDTTAEFMTDKYLRFQIGLEAIDPFKYGKWRSFESSAGSVGLFHYGNAESYPIVDVTGSASGGYTLEKSGWKVTVTRPLLSGETHSLDFRTGILRVDGVVARGALSFANFKPVRPGFTQDLTITVPSGSASFTGGLYDTYI